MRFFQVARVLGSFLLLGSALEAPAQQHLGNRSGNYSLALAQEIVAAHNAVRSRIGVPPLVWSDQMAAVAQNWANTLLARGAFEHHQDNPYGENLLEASGYDPTPSQVVNAWSSEAKNYRYAENTCSSVCGHYTQVVWRDTKAVGCGVVRDATREIWVCNYAPYGNIVGERPY